MLAKPIPFRGKPASSSKPSEIPTAGITGGHAVGAPATIAVSLPKNQDQETIARLATLSKVDYDRIRREEAKALGIQVKTLDDLVTEARAKGGKSDPLPFADVESHPEPISPAMVLDELADIIRRYVVLDKEQADGAALWIAMTWFIGEVAVAPIAIITAPEKACGKSQLLEVFSYLVCHPLSAASSSASFLFRAIQKWQPTILIDEADTFIRESDELKGLVNAGHTRANAFVGRTVAVGDGFEPKVFDVWGAKAFAGISLEKHLPDATMSRGIVIVLRRKLQHEIVSRLRHGDKSSFALIAAKLSRFADDYSKQVRTARPALPDELSDRAQDNWDPLLAIAGCAGPAWVARATEAALKLSGTEDQTVSTGNELLADIQQIFNGRQDVKISTADLIEALVADDEKAWGTYNRGRPLTPRQLAKQLAEYRIKPKTVRQKFSTPKGYDAMQFEDAFARYLDAPQKMPQRRNDSQVSIGGETVADETQRPIAIPAVSDADATIPFQSASIASVMAIASERDGVVDEMQPQERGPDTAGASTF